MGAHTTYVNVGNALHCYTPLCQDGFCNEEIYGGLQTFSRKDTVIQDAVYIERNIKSFHRA